MDVYGKKKEPVRVPFDAEKINAILGTDISREEMLSYFKMLDLEYDAETNEVIAPTFRHDLFRLADLAEEVARFHGYNNIPVTLMRGQTTLGGYSPEEKLEQRLGGMCRTMGCDEIITYSFISPTYYDKIRWEKNDPRRNSFKILNPLGEDTSIMRTTTLPSMLDILARNYNYRNKDVRLYELGRIYQPGGENGLANEAKVLTLGACGESFSFYDLKGTVEAILKDIRAEKVTFLPVADDPSYHPGRCAYFYSGSDMVGVLGQIHPNVAKNFGVDTELYCAELDFDELMNAKGTDPEYVPLPKFPSVTRDIAVVCREAVTVGALEKAIRKGAKGLLKEAALFDIYRGKGIDEGKKSVAFNLVLRADDRSLTSEEADEDVKAILEVLERDCGAHLR